MNKWRDFYKAREFVRSLNLKSEKQWKEYRKTNNRPNDIPSNPNRTYSNQWKGMGDWLGTFRIADKDRIYLTYNEAKEWAINSDINTLTEWRNACRLKKIPENVPNSPDMKYKTEWVSWSKFLRDETNYQGNWRPLKDVQNWAKKNNIFTKEDWEIACKNKDFPKDIPTNLHRTYSKEWKNWSVFFGRDIKGGSSVVEHLVRESLKRFIPIDEKIKILYGKRIDIVIKNRNLVIEYDGYHWHKNNEKKDIEINSIFKNNNWKIIRVREYPLKKISNDDLILKTKNRNSLKKTKLILEHCLEIGVIPKHQSNKIKSFNFDDKFSNSISKLLGWIPFEEAKEWAQSKDIKSETEWRLYKKNNKLPPNIPNNPNIVYLEWISWADFLGTKNIYISPNNWINYNQAKNWAINSGVKSAREWAKTDLPKGIPSGPDKVYKNDWVSWMDWLGFDCVDGQRKPWIEFEKAKLWVKKKGIKSETEWRKFCKEGLIPINIPNAPSYVYRKYWKGWKDFFDK